MRIVYDACMATWKRLRPRNDYVCRMTVHICTPIKLPRVIVRVTRQNRGIEKKSLEKVILTLPTTTGGRTSDHWVVMSCCLTTQTTQSNNSTHQQIECFVSKNKPIESNVLFERNQPHSPHNGPFSGFSGSPTRKQIFSDLRPR